MRAGTLQLQDRDMAIEPNSNFGRAVLALMLVAAVASGCATTEAYEKILEGMVGKHIDEVVRAWGPPDASHTFRDGSRSVKFSRERTVTVPGSVRRRKILVPSGGTYRTEYIEEQTDPTTEHFRCDTTFQVDRAGIIRGWSHAGNDCVAVAR